MSLQDIEFIDHLVEKICEYFKEAACRAIREHVQHTGKTSKDDGIQETNTSISTQIKCTRTEVQEESSTSQVSK